uniref:Uncharacterized protein n=1 Tax=Anguilla anguilla TaxID=7936 RepID=A0A0E9W290_ANGAN
MIRSPEQCSVNIQLYKGPVASGLVEAAVCLACLYQVIVMV